MVVLGPKAESSSSFSPSHYPKPLPPNGDSGRDTALLALQEEVVRLQAALNDRPTGPGPMGKMGGGLTRAQQQWKLITLVLDRLFALLFFLINVIAIFSLLPMPSDEWTNGVPSDV